MTTTGTELELLDLPDDILLRIASYVNVFDIAPLGMVCKRMHAVCAQQVLYQIKTECSDECKWQIPLSINKHIAFVLGDLESAARGRSITPMPSPAWVCVAAVLHRPCRAKKRINMQGKELEDELGLTMASLSYARAKEWITEEEAVEFKLYAILSALFS